ncbi:putative coiled-coil domain-containing protein [Sesbania bispinosa]|nr:putative coiled-coil domain-containing protein [Sesbania bispinosa]
MRRGTRMKPYRPGFHGKCGNENMEGRPRPRLMSGLMPGMRNPTLTWTSGIKMTMVVVLILPRPPAQVQGEILRPQRGRRTGIWPAKGGKRTREVRSSNDDLEREVNGLKASVEPVGKELKSYKTRNESLKTMKEKAKKNNFVLKAEVKRLREDLALRTAEVEAVRKEAEDLRAEKEQTMKVGGSSVEMDKQDVAALIKKNLARHQTK